MTFNACTLWKQYTGCEFINATLVLVLLQDSGPYLQSGNKSANVEETEVQEQILPPTIQSNNSVKQST